MKPIRFNSSAELSIFCHELSKHIHVPASKIKHGIARMNGHNHVSSFISLLGGQGEFCHRSLNEASWQRVLDLFSGVNDLNEGYHRAAKSLLSVIFLCIAAEKGASASTYSAADILKFTEPLVIIQTGVPLYLSSDDQKARELIYSVISNTPGIIFSDLTESVRKGDDLAISNTILDKLRFLTMQIEYAVHNFESIFPEQ